MEREHMNAKHMMLLGLLILAIGIILVNYQETSYYPIGGYNPLTGQHYTIPYSYTERPYFSGGILFSFIGILVLLTGGIYYHLKEKTR